MSIHGFFQTVPLEGTALALLGAALAVGLPCAGSATGVGTVGRAGAGLLSVDPGKFSRVLVMQILPGTQGLYGLVIWFFALTKLGFFFGRTGASDAVSGTGVFRCLLAGGPWRPNFRHCSGQDLCWGTLSHCQEAQ